MNLVDKLRAKLAQAMWESERKKFDEALLDAVAALENIHYGNKCKDVGCGCPDGKAEKALTKLQSLVSEGE